MAVRAAYESAGVPIGELRASSSLDQARRQELIGSPTRLQQLRPGPVMTSTTRPSSTRMTLPGATGQYRDTPAPRS